MAVNSVFYSSTSVSDLKAQQAIANYQKYEETQDEEETEETLTDSYTQSDSSVSSDTGIYTKENIRKTLDEIEEQRTQAMTNMIYEMLNMQASSNSSSTQSSTSQSSLSLDDITSAQESISDDGYWSVDSVASRIMDMAKLLAGDDTSKLETLKSAVIKGFGNAVKSYGADSLDDMPEITRQTYTEVMNRFDEWSSQTE